MNRLLPILLAAFVPVLCSAQLRVVKAVASGKKYVDWPRVKKEYEKEDPQGPGFFYNDCAQSISPLKSSSTLPNQGSKNYSIKNLSDFDPMTAWVEGKAGYGIGEFFEIRSGGPNVIYNGYQSSINSWSDNSRVKRFKVYRNGKPICYIDLLDVMDGQHFEMPGVNYAADGTESLFRFEIVEVYKGDKWPDVAVSEIMHVACCVSGNTMIENPSSAQAISELKSGDEVYTVDLDKGTLEAATVVKTAQVLHLSLFRLVCGGREIQLTGNHPLYFKGVGFTTIGGYMKSKGIEDYKDLVGQAEFMMWDEKSGKTVFEKLTDIELRKGDFQTYSILQLSTGNTFVANGFVTKVY